MFRETRSLGAQLRLGHGRQPVTLSRVLRRVDYKTPSLSLVTKASEVLGLPPDYFPDVREAAVISVIKTDPDLRDRLYDRINKQGLPT